MAVVFAATIELPYAFARADRLDGAGVPPV